MVSIVALASPVHPRVKQVAHSRFTALCGFYYILLASRHKWDMSIELLLTRAIPDDEADYIGEVAYTARSGRMSLKRKR